MHWPRGICVCLKLSHFSPVQLFAALWAVACQAPLSMGFSKQEYWSGLPCPPPGDLPDPGIEPASSCSSYTGRRVLYPGGFFAIWETGISVSLCLIPSLSCDPHTRLRSLLCLSARGLSVPFIITERSMVPPFGTCLISVSWPLLPGLTLFLQSAFLSPRP